MTQTPCAEHQRSTWVYGCLACNPIKQSSMTLTRILAEANAVYPDGMIDAYVSKPRRDHGDTLAQFIVNEIKSMYDGRLESVVVALEAAERELSGVVTRLRNLLHLERNIR